MTAYLKRIEEHRARMSMSRVELLDLLQMAEDFYALEGTATYPIEMVLSPYFWKLRHWLAAKKASTGASAPRRGGGRSTT